MNRSFSFILIVFLLFHGPESMDAYDDKVTHPDLTRIATDKSNLDQYLMNIGYPKGVDTSYGGKTIVDLLKQGSTHEDTTPRAYNHFYNPITDSGLDDEVLFWEFTGESSLDWARGYSDAGNLDDCEPVEYSFSNHQCNAYAWRKAKESFYTALTSKTQQDRDKHLMVFYEQLGRILHLLEDAGVPAHTRNDFKGHISCRKLTDYRLDLDDPLTIITGWFSNLYEYRVEKNPELVTRAIVLPEHVPDLREFNSFESFWDRNHYRGDDPSVTAPQGDNTLTCGLAEYSNVNFLSTCSMFPEGLEGNDRHYFPYPSMQSTRHVDVDAGWGRKRRYLQKTGHGDTGYYVARCELWDSPLLAAGYYVEAFKLDNVVHDEYARRLIPRAIGYTAGLINYFFRGTLEITPPSEYFYGLAESTPGEGNTNPPKQFTEITLRLKNTSPEGEEMTAGRLVCVARYRAPKDPDKQFPAWEDFVEGVDKNGAPILVEYRYSISEPVYVVYELSVDESTSQRKEAEFTFTFEATDIPETNQAIPANVYELELFVIYRGELGQEEGAVAVGRVDVCEPAVLEVFNDSDYFTILDEPIRTVAGNDLDQDGQEDFRCSPLDCESTLTFFGPVQEQSGTSQQPSPEKVITFTVGAGSSRSYLLLQDQNYFSCRRAGQCTGENQQTEDLVLLGNRNQYYWDQTGEKTHDALAKEYTASGFYYILTLSNSHRGISCHQPLIEGVYGYCSQRKAVDASDDLYTVYPPLAHALPTL